MADDEIIKKHTKAVYKVWKNPGMNWKHKLREMLLEILIIVFAITLSLFFERWRQNAEDHNLEKKFLQGLKVDLTKDVQELKLSSSKWVSLSLISIVTSKNYTANNLMDITLPQHSRFIVVKVCQRQILNR